MTLQEIAARMVQCPKGILAADESTGTMTKRLTSIGVESTPETRNAFRDVLFRTPNLNQYISGVILFDETFRNKELTLCLSEKGILPGIKVDQGTSALFGQDTKETMTNGLDANFDDRLKEYASLGAKFTKWRAVLLPSASEDAMFVNAQQLARFAFKSQQAGMVPIVEPEALMDGDHDIETSCKTTYNVLAEVFYQLHRHDVKLDSIVLKPNMVLSGYSCKTKDNTYEVARKTLCCLMHAVPPIVPGIAFLSGGQPDDVAATNLNSINKLAKSYKMVMQDGVFFPKPAPWRLTFSFGRGLQQAALKAWQGKEENRRAAQEALIRYANMNSIASKGEL